MARAAGFDNISLDLMMWLPQQTVAQWLESVDALIALGPDHASMYLLEIYPNAPLRDAMARAQWSLAPDDDAAEMYLSGLDRMDNAGYVQYEISNVARPGRESRHNLKYWTRRGVARLRLRRPLHAGRCPLEEPVVNRGVHLGRRRRRTLGAERRALSGRGAARGGAVHRPSPDGGHRLTAVKARYGVDVWARYRRGVAAVRGSRGF